MCLWGQYRDIYYCPLSLDYTLGALEGGTPSLPSYFYLYVIFILCDLQIGFSLGDFGKYYNSKQQPYRIVCWEQLDAIHIINIRQGHDYT